MKFPDDTSLKNALNHLANLLTLAFILAIPVSLVVMFSTFYWSGIWMKFGVAIPLALYVFLFSKLLETKPFDFICNKFKN